MKNNFRTSIEVNRWPFALSHNQKYLSIGSCFSEHIGEKLKASKFDILINPFGQQYNPAAIGSGLRALMSERNYQSTDLVKQDGLLHSLEHHGSFSGAEEKEVLANMNRQRALATVQLRQAHTLFVTFRHGSCFQMESHRCHSF
jgi:hypothetical protein